MKTHYSLKRVFSRFSIFSFDGSSPWILLLNPFFPAISLKTLIFHLILLFVVLNARLLGQNWNWPDPVSNDVIPYGVS